MTHAAIEPKRNRTRLIILVVVLVLVVGAIVFAVTRQDRDTPSQAPGQTATAASPEVLVTPNRSMPAPPSAPASATSEDPRTAACTVVDEGFVPDRFTIERFGVDEPIIARNLDKDGNIAAPPLDEPRMASWWSGGPKPGDARGKAVLTIHTYRTGNALGNELYADGTSQFQHGDVIKLHGPAGQVKCYEYTGAERIFVKDYDPDSTVMLDPEGPPSLTIIICWDFDRATEHWDSRVFFHFTPVTPEAADA